MRLLADDAEITPAVVAAAVSFGAELFEESTVAVADVAADVVAADVAVDVAADVAADVSAVDDVVVAGPVAVFDAAAAGVADYDEPAVIGVAVASAVVVAVASFDYSVVGLLGWFEPPRASCQASAFSNATKELARYR